MFAVMAASRPETWQKASDEILREVYRLRDELVGPEELAKAKKQKAAELVFGRQTVQQAADSLGRNFITAGDPLFDKTYVEGIQKVTAEQVRDVARRYFVPERLNRVIIAPPGGGAEAGRKNAAKAAEGEIRLERLPNGLRVLLKRDAHLPLVNIQAFVLGGSLVDTRRRPAARAWWRANARPGHGRPLRPGKSPSTSIRSAARWRWAPGGSPSTAAPRRCGTIFPRRPALFAECFTRPTFPRGRVRQGAAACPGGDRPPGRRSARGNQRVLLRQPARRLALPRHPGRQGRDGAKAHGQGPAGVSRQVFRAEQHGRDASSATSTRTRPWRW